MTRRTGPSEIQPDPWEPSAATCDDVQNLLDAVTERMHDRDSGETFLECKVCGEVDSHHVRCFVPAMADWLGGDDPNLRMVRFTMDELNVLEHCVQTAMGAFRESAAVLRATGAIRSPEHAESFATAFDGYMRKAGRVQLRLRDAR